MPGFCGPDLGPSFWSEGTRKLLHIHHLFEFSSPLCFFCLCYMFFEVNIYLAIDPLPISTMKWVQSKLENEVSAIISVFSHRREWEGREEKTKHHLAWPRFQPENDWIQSSKISGSLRLTLGNSTSHNCTGKSLSLNSLLGKICFQENDVSD